MYCRKCGKIVRNRTDLCSDRAASRITSSQSGRGDMAQGEAKQGKAVTPFSKNNMGDPKNAFKIDANFSCCEWFVIIFGSILLALYIFSNSVLLSGLTGATIFLSLLMFILFSFCGFACFSFPLAQKCAFHSGHRLKIKIRMLLKLYHDHLFRNIIPANEMGDSPCKLMMMANGALIFIFCLILSAISLFANIDYGYGQLNFLNAVLVSLFFLNLGLLYLSFSLVVVETSRNFQARNEKRCS